MKILFLSRLFSPHIGGVEKHVMEISEILIKHGHTVTVITERYEKKLKKTETVKGISIHRIDTGKENRDKKLRIWKEMLRLKNLIEESDVIHCHDVFFWYLPFRFLYPKKPVYTTFHGYESYPIKKNAIRMRKISEKLSWGNICIGDFIPKWYGTKPTMVSYGATEIFRDTKVPFKKESAVFIGRLDEQTGVLTYAKAVEWLRKKHPKFALTIVGDGKDRKKLEKNFTVLGFQNDPERYFSKFHFAFVSRYLSILEALAAKKLIFAVYDNPVKEDYLKLSPFAKWIIIENDPQKLADQISFYLTHPQEEGKLIEKGYEWVKNQTWEEMVKLYERLWNKK